jgi:hypothetical protein
MPDQSEPSAEERAENLKERIYVTFTALAVVLALRSDADEVTAETAAATLVITVVGILLAVLTADFISHLVVHARMPSRGEAAHMVRVCVGASGAVVLPLVFVVLAGTGVWRIEAALRASAIALLVALGVVAFLAVRRVRIPGWQKVLVLLAEVVLGAAVIGLELLAHG